jgi:hypothetical protein
MPMVAQMKGNHLEPVIIIKFFLSLALFLKQNNKTCQMLRDLSSQADDRSLRRVL